MRAEKMQLVFILHLAEIAVVPIGKASTNQFFCQIKV